VIARCIKRFSGNVGHLALALVSLPVNGSK